MSVAWSLLVIAFFVALLVYDARQTRKRKAMFAACGARLGAEGFTQTSSSITGVVRGLPLEVRFVPSSKNSPARTVITVTCQPCSLLLELRRQTTAEETYVKKGEAVDLVLGDAAFDAAWIVEGAPAERVTRLLAEPTLRGRLTALSFLDAPSVKIEDGKLTLERNGTDVGADAVDTDRIELALALAEAVIEDARTPLESAAIDAAASDYRTARKVDPGADDAAAIAQLKKVRALRTLGQVRIGAIAASAITTALLTTVLISDASAPAAIALLVFALVTTLAFGSVYRTARRSAPDVPPDRLLVRCWVASWVINVLVVAAMFVK